MTDYRVKKTDEEWRKALEPMQYQVARHAATERPFTGKYWDHWQEGRYDCVGCGTGLHQLRRDRLRPAYELMRTR